MKSGEIIQALLQIFTPVKSHKIFNKLYCTENLTTFLPARPLLGYSCVKVICGNPVLKSHRDFIKGG